MYFKAEKPEQVTTPSCSKTHYQKTASSSCTVSSQMSGEELFHLEECDSEGYRPPKWHSYKEASSFYAMRGKSRSNCYSD